MLTGASWVVGSKVLSQRLDVTRSGLSYVIAGLLKTGVGAIGVWMAMEIAFEAVVECGGEAFIGCAG